MIQAFKLGSVGQDTLTNVKYASAKATEDNGYMTLEKPVGTDYQVTAGYTLNITRVLFANESAGAGFEIGYGDDENGIGFRYTITANASATMKAICATVKSEGGQHINDMEGLNRGVSMGNNLTTVSTTIIPLISIRPKSLFKTYKNKGIALPKGFSVYTDNPIALYLIHDAILTAPTWGDVDTSDSMMEYDVSASAYSNGHAVSVGHAGGAKNSGESELNALGKIVLWDKQGSGAGILTLAAERIGTTNADVSAGLNWGEIR